MATWRKKKRRRPSTLWCDKTTTAFVSRFFTGLRGATVHATPKLLVVQHQLPRAAAPHAHDDRRVRLADAPGLHNLGGADGRGVVCVQHLVAAGADVVRGDG